MSESKLSLADANQDKLINIADVAVIQLYIIGKISKIGPDFESENLPPLELQLANGIYDLKKSFSKR